MKLIKRLNEITSRDDEEEKYDYEKIEFMHAFFSAIADADMLDDYPDDVDRWALIDENFEITRQGSSFHVTQVSDLIHISHNDMAILAKRWEFKLDYIESYRIDLTISTTALPKSVGVLSCVAAKEKDLERLSSCKILSALYVNFYNGSVINMIELPLHMYKNIVLNIGHASVTKQGERQQFSKTIINLEPALKIIANNKITLICNLFPDQNNQRKLHEIMADLLKDKNINKAIDRIIDAGLEDIL